MNVGFPSCDACGVCAGCFTRPIGESDGRGAGSDPGGAAGKAGGEGVREQSSAQAASRVG
jgi:hypothetical protein